MPIDFGGQGAITGLVIYDSRLFARTGHVGRWATSVSAKLTLNTIVRTPVNKRQVKSHWDAMYPPGSMKAGWSGDADRIGPRHWQITLTNPVPYTEYVLGGTKAITPTDQPYLTLPVNPAFGRRRRHNVVRGQRRNNFLLGAARATARSHSSLRGMGDMLFQQW